MIFLSLSDLRNEFEHRMRRRSVDAGGRFVEHQDVWPRRQCAGDEHALFLATGEFGKPLVSKLFSTRRPQAFTGEGAFAWRDKTPRTDAPIHAHQGNLEPRQQIYRIELRGLRDVTEHRAVRPWVRRQ